MYVIVGGERNKKAAFNEALSLTATLTSLFELRSTFSGYVAVKQRLLETCVYDQHQVIKYCYPTVCVCVCVCVCVRVCACVSDVRSNVVYSAG